MKEQGCQTDWVLDPNKHFTVVSDGTQEKAGFGHMKENVIWDEMPWKSPFRHGKNIWHNDVLERETNIDVGKKAMSPAEEGTLGLMYEEEQELIIEEREYTAEEGMQDKRKEDHGWKDQGKGDQVMEDQRLEADGKLYFAEKCDWSVTDGTEDNGDVVMEILREESSRVNTCQTNSDQGQFKEYFDVNTNELATCVWEPKMEDPLYSFDMTKFGYSPNHGLRSSSTKCDVSIVTEDMSGCHMDQIKSLEITHSMDLEEDTYNDDFEYLGTSEDSKVDLDIILQDESRNIILEIIEVLLQNVYVKSVQSEDWEKDLEVEGEIKQITEYFEKVEATDFCKDDRLSGNNANGLPEDVLSSNEEVQDIWESNNGTFSSKIEDTPGHYIRVPNDVTSSNLATDYISISTISPLLSRSKHCDGGSTNMRSTDTSSRYIPPYPVVDSSIAQNDGVSSVTNKSCLHMCLSDIYCMIATTKEAEHFRWAGQEIQGRYFQHTEAEVDLHTVEERVMCQYYKTSADFRSDFETISLICHKVFGSADLVTQSALYLLALVDQQLGVWGLGPCVAVKGIKRKGKGSRGARARVKRGRRIL